MIQEANEKTIQIKNNYTDFRGNHVTSGIYKPGTILIQSLTKADYIVIEQESDVEDLNKNFIPINSNKGFVKQNNPVTLKPIEVSNEPIKDTSEGKITMKRTKTSEVLKEVPVE